MGVAAYPASYECPAPRRGLQVVSRANVVLDREGNAVEATADLAGLAFRVSGSGNGISVGVDLQYGAM